MPWKTLPLINLLFRPSFFYFRYRLIINSQIKYRKNASYSIFSWNQTNQFKTKHDLSTSACLFHINHSIKLWYLDAPFKRCAYTHDLKEWEKKKKTFRGHTIEGSLEVVRNTFQRKKLYGLSNYFYVTLESVATF